MDFETIVASHDIYSLQKSQQVRSGKLIQPLTFSEHLTLRVNSEFEFEASYFPSQKSLNLFSQKRRHSYLFEFSKVGDFHFELGETSFEMLRQLRLKWQIDLKKKKSRRKIENLSEFKKVVGVCNINMKGCLKRKKLIQKQTNIDDYEVAISENERYADLNILLFNQKLSYLKVHRKLDHNDSAKSSLRIQKKKLKEFFKMIEKQYLVNAFLYYFLRK